MATGTPVQRQLVVLAAAVVASFWVLNAQPALAYRTLRPSPGLDDQSTDMLGNIVNHYACGFYDTADPRDGGFAHQPCYGADRAIQFCCLSGSSKCSCPAAAGYTMGCFNYEDGHSLNANTGEECGYFLPNEAPPTSVRRFLAACQCPQEDLCGNPLVQSNPGSNLRCNPNGGPPADACNYDKRNGQLRGDSNSTGCCPNIGPCGSGSQ
ncbi:hypothetical protein KFL_004090130 [Klebsormidium nitens]|uniref:Uncharacterized protein n=1 Tax=Klebsormidium nitens TaxID=105231 RepID=A0A1Y1IGM8_KLENI|nr:hypothetical protein KFL_004090130 [Klebsormidium nitens]|eukprot:GAQ88211.1 hypothetical protein KFL_004090130 [Klebsormidium nitens]